MCRRAAAAAGLLLLLASLVLLRMTSAPAARLDDRGGWPGRLRLRSHLIQQQKVTDTRNESDEHGSGTGGQTARAELFAAAAPVISPLSRFHSQHRCRLLLSFVGRIHHHRRSPPAIAFILALSAPREHPLTPARLRRLTTCLPHQAVAPRALNPSATRSLCSASLHQTCVTPSSLAVAVQARRLTFTCSQSPPTQPHYQQKLLYRLFHPLNLCPSA